MTTPKRFRSVLERVPQIPKNCPCGKPGRLTVACKKCSPPDEGFVTVKL